MYGDADAPAGRPEVFKLYSQAKLGMMREALAKLDRTANERVSNFRTERPQWPILFTVFARSQPSDGAGKEVGIVVKGVNGRAAGI
jgi:hypothetical protein